MFTTPKQPLVQLSLPYHNLSTFAATDRAYLAQDSRLASFYRAYPTWDNLQPQLAPQPIANRQVLHDAFTQQYAKLTLSAAQANNIAALLDERTFTVTTAHQPCLFTGPLYFIYKIFSTINLAEELGRRHLDYRFVPVFWNGGEDHDFEEVNHLNLFGKRLTWDDKQGGAVSAYTTASLKPLLTELQTILGTSENALHIFARLEAAVNDNDLYADMLRQLLQEFFAQYGLLVLDPMSRDLKAQFISVFKDDLTQQSAFSLVNNTIEQLQKQGFKAQAAPREINVFYLQANSRERIVRLADGNYGVNNTNLVFSESELLQRLHEQPELFSPNVILRPLYQETLLPNIAWIGGGGEVAYWLERKTLFEHYKIPYPILVRRNSVLLMEEAILNKWTKLGFTIEDLFEELSVLQARYVNSNADSSLSLETERHNLEALFEQIAQKAKSVDASLEGSVKAELVKTLKGLEQLEARLFKAEKQKYDTALNQISTLKGKAFPEGNLQERHDNFLSFYIKYGEGLMQTLKERLQPIDANMDIIVLGATPKV